MKTKNGKVNVAQKRIDTHNIDAIVRQWYCR